MTPNLVFEADPHREITKEYGRREFIFRAGLALVSVSTFAAVRSGVLADDSFRRAKAKDDAPPSCEFEDSPSGREQPAPPYSFPPIPKQRTRESLATVVADPSKLRKLSDAYDALKRLSADDPRNWCTQANMHYNHCSFPPPNPNYYRQIHGNPFFFPWHRAYLFFYEGILGKLIGDEIFALPYWDWGKAPVIPDVFFDSHSPLYYPFRDVKQGDSILNDPDNGPQVDPGNIDRILHQPTFSDFWPDVENGPHNAGHLWVGGHMGSFPRAARDFLFFTHHANVDRLWSAWRGSGGHPDPTYPGWKTQWFNFWDPADDHGKLVSVTTGDLLDLTKVNVTYAPSTVEVILAADHLEIPGKPYHTKPASIATLLKVTSKKSRPAGSAVKLVIDGLEAPLNAALLIRVFANNPKADADTPTDDGFLGTFLIVPMTELGKDIPKMAPHHARTMTLDVTDRIASVLRKMQKEQQGKKELTITLVPLGSDKKPSSVRIRFKSIRVVAGGEE